ncbi:unnamed protein product [Dovyalis caffra]|uniref:Uncharacterized protein n=1 Tax=Dovyalis caffra TaxID=77055 RepID=A0AAV1R8A0_9ROSI|nr:unnamed protein product [Dovyalis caffra]
MMTHEIVRSNLSHRLTRGLLVVRSTPYWVSNEALISWLETSWKLQEGEDEMG